MTASDPKRTLSFPLGAEFQAVRHWRKHFRSQRGAPTGTKGKPRHCHSVIGVRLKMRADVNADADIEIAKAIFEAFVAKDRKAADSLIAENFSFTSPLDNALNRDAYFTICWPNSETMKSVDYCYISNAGNRVFVTYEADIIGGKRIRNTEVLTVTDGKISAVEVYFGWNLPHQVAMGDHQNP